MKNLVTLILICLSAYSTQAQRVLTSNMEVVNNKEKANEKLNIPISAKRHFSHNYGNAQKRSWSSENDGGYRIQYRAGRNHYTVRYSKKGDWISDERHLVEQQVPLPILDAFQKTKYRDGHIEGYSFVRNKKYQDGVYVLTLTLRSKQSCLYYHTTGKLLRIF